MNFLIEVRKDGQKLHQIVWDSEHPMPLGHPVRWVVESTPDSLRMRDLTGSLGQAYEHGCLEIPMSSLGGDREVEIQGAGLSFVVRKLKKPEPVWRASSPNGHWVIYTCVRGAVLETNKFETGETLFHDGRRIMAKIRKEGHEYILEPHSRPIDVTLGDSLVRTLDPGTNLRIPEVKLPDLEVTNGAKTWRVGRAENVALPESTLEVLDPESLWFKNALKKGAIAFAVAFIAIMLIPNGKVETPDEEVIPAQFAKIILQPQEVKKGGGGDPLAGGLAAGEKQPNQEAKAPTKASNTAVARAFRSQALQNSVKGLMKGGMTTFLAQSGNLMIGADSTNQIRKITEGGANSAFPSSPDAGFERGPNVNVAAVGGGGLGGKGGTGQGVGYGKGERAGIGGQGGAFVSLDIPGANVEEGLSKDEVGKVIHSHLSEVRYCYESSMLRNPEIEGKLVLDFSIGPSGGVTTAAVKESSLSDPRLDDCILRRLTKWAFPKPKGAVTVAVSYPFIFKALQR